MTSRPPTEPPAASTEPATRFNDDHVPTLLARAAHILAQEFQAELRRRGVTLPAWRVLACLHGLEGGETVSGLAARCQLLQPTMTKLLDRMTREGQVRRGPDPRDRRVVRVALTPAGARLAAELATAARRQEAAALAAFDAAEVAALRARLRSLIARAGRDA